MNVNLNKVAKVVLEALKEGPKTAPELYREIKKIRGVTESNFPQVAGLTMFRLEADQLIKRHGNKVLRCS